VVGPALIAQLREAQLRSSIPQNLVYDRTLYTMVCNLLVRPVSEKHLRSDEPSPQHSLQPDSRAADAQTAARGSFGALGVLVWLAVGIPLLIGLFIALDKAAALF
jgi:hypothetical protein